MDKHEELNSILTPSQPVPEPPTPSKRRKSKATGVNEKPTRSQIIHMPLYARTNKKKNQVKGEVRVELVFKTFLTWSVQLRLC